MSEWELKSIEDLKSKNRYAISMGPFGSRIKRENFVKSGVPVIKGGNLNSSFINEDEFDFLTESKADELISSNAKRRDIVITHRGTIGQVGIIPDNSKFDRYVVSQSQLKVSIDEDQANPYYIYYFLRSSLGQHELLLNSSQVGVPAIAQASTSVKKIKIPTPPLQTQNKIVEFLLNIDQKIELNQRMNETLEGMARAIFKSWFVDFDPVHAKAAGRQPEGMDERTAALFPSTFTPNGLPEGWEETTLERIAFLNPESWGKSNHPDNVEYVDLANTKWGVVESTQQYIWNDAPSRARRVLQSDDTIVGTVRPGNGSYSYIGGSGLTGSTGFAVLRPKKSEYAEAVFCAATSKDNIERLAHLADGGAYPAVRPDVVLDTPFIFAGDDLLSAFSGVAKLFVEKIEANKKQNQTLAALCDTLLPKLISGELRVNTTAEKPKETV